MMILRKLMNHITNQNWVATGMVFAFFVLTSGPATALSMDSPSKPTMAAMTALDVKVEAFMKENNVPGALVAVASKGDILSLKTYGEANVELSVPVGPDTVFEIGSVSKQFVVTAALLLIEEGKLSLNDPIHKYLPYLPSEWIGITVYQLMTHTSGIPDYEEIRSYDVYRFRLTPEEIIRIAHSRPVDFAPGEGWYYSNTAYVLLSMIVERIDGKPLGKVLKARIFDPLEMNQTRMADPEAIIPNRASGYWVNKVGELINRQATETSSTLGAGGMLSSAGDMAKWDAALYDDSILKEETKTMMWTLAEVPKGENKYHYALGWSVGPYHGLKSQSHDGQVAGFITKFRRLPDQELMFLIFVNRYRVRTSNLEKALIQTFLPDIGLNTVE